MSDPNRFGIAGGNIIPIGPMPRDEVHRIITELNAFLDYRRAERLRGKRIGRAARKRRRAGMRVHNARMNREYPLPTVTFARNS